MPIELTDEFRSHLASAVANGHPVVWASVDGEGRPKHSIFGSSQVFESDQLAIWVRHADVSGAPDPVHSGFLGRIAGNPSVAAAYLNLPERLMWRFEGRARVVDDEATRTRIYDASPERERSQDLERTGVAVVVDLDRVVGFGFEQTR